MISERIQRHRYLHEEVMRGFSFARPDCVVVPVPNGAWFPAGTHQERALVARVVRQMVDEGQMLPGVGDLVLLWDTGSAAIELKPDAEWTALGKRSAGRPSDAQLEFEGSCAAHRVRHLYAHSWSEVEEKLVEWGRIRP